MGNIWDIKGRYKAAMAYDIRGQRALFGGGAEPGKSATIDSVEISSAGDATDFGDLSVARSHLGASGNNVRTMFFGGEDPSAYTNVVDYVIPSSLGNAADFGDLQTASLGPLGHCSTNMRAIKGGGRGGSPAAAIDEIDYMQIATTGNAVDFLSLIHI